MPKAASVQLTDVSLCYDGGPMVLDGVSLEVPAGGFHTVLGPSGCGKSTLLRLMAGLLVPASGRVSCGGGDPCHGRDSGPGFVFQEPALMPWLNVRDNIALPLRLAGVDRERRHARAAELAAGMALGDCLSYYPRQLSGGMKMRVSVARALATAPGVMLFDEPFTGLDAIRRDRFGEDLLEVWRREGWTAVFVTHNVAEAVFLAQNVIVLGDRPGRVVATHEVSFPYPRPASLRTEPEFQKIVAAVSDDLREVAP